MTQSNDTCQGAFVYRKTAATINTQERATNENYQRSLPFCEQFDTLLHSMI